ncbi:MAG: threonylcarbamoyl-AMP synthase [Bacteroidetes bacterium HGW-Bacteroidetes-22]|nr:MAG: threonylcarbamoyl-AMP synthase [Bacteroidetes bacterium HGW-Bacteroidetes-22]
MNEELINADLDQSVDALRKGGVILYPTDTIWGLGCDATNSKAVEKIYTIKKRNEGKSLIILVDSEEMLTHYVQSVPAIVHDLIEQYERPLTIIYPDARNLPKNLIAPDGSIAIRIVRNVFCRGMIAQFGKPITSTSANVSGLPSPASFQAIPEEVILAVDYTVAHGRDDLKATFPSTIIRIDTNGEFEIIRS